MPDAEDGGGQQAEIYTYESSSLVYSMNWSVSTSQHTPGSDHCVVPMQTLNQQQPALWGLHAAACVLSCQCGSPLGSLSKCHWGAPHSITLVKSEVTSGGGV